MSKFLPAALALATASAGCFAAGEGDITASWTITSDGAPSTCQAVGATDVELHATRQKDNLEYTQKVACDLGAVTFQGFKPGLYTAEVRLLDGNGNVLSDPMTITVHIGGGDLIDLGTFEFAFGSQGRFSATWAITMNGAVSTCAAVGATTFQIVSQSGGQTYTDKFDCTAGSALTEPLPAGSWAVSVSLLDAKGVVLNSVPVNLTLDLAAGETKSLGEFEFAF